MTTFNQFAFDNVKLKSYKVIIKDPYSGREIDISDFVIEISRSYDLEQPAERIDIKALHFRGARDIFQTGNRLFISGYKMTRDGFEYGEMHRTIIFETTINTEEGGNVNIISYDPMIYLQKNIATHTLSPDNNETASDFIRKICILYNIPIKFLQHTGIILDRELFINRTLWDMIVTALARTREKDAEHQYVVRWDIDGIYLFSRIDIFFTWVLESTPHVPGTYVPGNIISATSKEDINEYRNIIRVYGSPKSSILNELVPTEEVQLLAEATASDDDINRYGMLVHSVTSDSSTDEANAAQQASDLLRFRSKINEESNIVAVNINSLYAGIPILIREPITGTIGKYYVKSGRHIITDDEVSMMLTVRKEFDLPEGLEIKKEKQNDFYSDLLGVP